MKKQIGYVLTEIFLVLFLALSTVVMMGNMFITAEEIIVAVVYILFIVGALYLMIQFTFLMEEKFHLKDVASFVSFVKKYVISITIASLHVIAVILNWIFYSYYVGRWIPEGLIGVQILLIGFLVIKEMKYKDKYNQFLIRSLVILFGYVALAFSVYFVLASIIG
jgi:hypothetical protein